MPMHRPLGAIILYGGWLLLFNPDPNRPDAPLATWKRVKEFDTNYSCQQKRNEEVADLLAKASKNAGKGKKDKSVVTPSQANLRYVCQRAEQVPKKR
jgi:hypothetical protein